MSPFSFEMQSTTIELFYDSESECNAICNYEMYAGLHKFCRMSTCDKSAISAGLDPAWIIREMRV